MTATFPTQADYYERLILDLRALERKFSVPNIEFSALSDGGAEDALVGVIQARGDAFAEYEKWATWVVEYFTERDRYDNAANLPDGLDPDDIHGVMARYEEFCRQFDETPLQEAAAE